MNYKTISVLFVVMLGLLLSGCNQKTSSENPFIGGTNGLLVNFLEGAPPQEVFDSGTSPFQVIVELTNDGEYTIPKGSVEVRLVGFNPEDFGLSASDIVKQPSEDLEGVRKDLSGNKIPGTTTQIVFPQMNYEKQISVDHEFPIRAEVCYNYQTKVSSVICVKRDLTDTSSTICNVKEKKKVYSSGAPIQVTSFEENPAGSNRVQFTFTIEQKGNGDVFKRNTMCKPSESETQFSIKNKVYVSVDTGLPGLRCNGLIGGDTAGYVVLASGKRTINCVQDVNVESDFEQPVNILLDYNFRNMKETSVIVRKQV